MCSHARHVMDASPNVSPLEWRVHLARVTLCAGGSESGGVAVHGALRRGTGRTCRMARLPSTGNSCIMQPPQSSSAGMLCRRRSIEACAMSCTLCCAADLADVMLTDPDRAAPLSSSFTTRTADTHLPISGCVPLANIAPLPLISSCTAAPPSRRVAAACRCLTPAAAARRGGTACPGCFLVAARPTALSY